MIEEGKPKNPRYSQVSLSLKEAGLTAKEALIYEVLIKGGEMPIGSVIKHTGSHPQVVYRAIDGLVAKGLVSQTIRAKKRHLIAEDPDVLVKTEERRLDRLRKTARALEGARNKPGAAFTRVYVGEEAFRSQRFRLLDQIKPGGTLSILGASGDRYYEIMGPRLKEFEVARVKKRILRKMLILSSQQKQMQHYDPRMGLTEIKILPSSYSNPSAVNIAGDVVAQYVWAEEPVAILINSREIAATHRKFFELQWKQASRWKLAAQIKDGS